MTETPSLNIPPPSVASALPSANNATTSLPTVLLSLPPALSDVQRPLALTGTLFDLMTSGQMQMQTALGTLTLRIAELQQETLKTLTDLLATPTGRSQTVELVVQSGTPPQKATLVIPTKTDAPEALTRAAKQTEAKLGPQPPHSAASKTEGATIKATVLPEALSLAPQADSAPREAPRVPDFVQRVLAQRQAATANATPPADAPPQPAAQQASPQSTAPASSSAPLEAGRAVAIKVAQMIPPDGDFPDAPPPDQIKATVIGRSMTGHTLIEAEGKTLFLHDKADIPVGTKLLITAKPLAEDAPTLLPQPQDHDFAPLREIAEALAALSPKGSAAFLHARAPTPAHHFAATTLFLLSALHGGRMDEWLGPAALHALDRHGTRDLKHKLTDALKAALDAPAQDATIGEWRSYPIPIHYGEAFELLRLYVHKDRAQAEDARDANALSVAKTRFVITLNMTKLGPIQLDGLSQKHKLDLVIRSERALPDPVMASIRAAGLSALEAVGLSGTLHFQTGRTQWVTIQDRAAAASSGAIVT